MRVLFSTLLLLGIVACGTAKQDVKAPSHETTFLEDQKEALYTFRSTQGKTLHVLFYNQSSEVISQKDHTYPLGARRAHVSFDEHKNDPLIAAFYATCCQKQLPLSQKIVSPHVIYLQDFELKNPRYRLHLKFQSGDEAIFPSSL